MAPKITAHRGASKEAPENTLSSVKAALAMGVNFVEIDVRLTKDWSPLILHDPNFERTGLSFNTPLIHELEAQHLMNIDVGSWFSESYIGEFIPSLAQILSLEWKQTGMMLEIKESPQEKEHIVQGIIRILNESNTDLKQLIVGSFCPEIMLRVKERLPQIKIPTKLIGILEDINMVTPFLEIGITHLAICNYIADADFLKSLKGHGLEVWIFTVDDPSRAKELVAHGADGIITNDPRVLISHFRSNDDLGANQHNYSTL